MDKYKTSTFLIGLFSKFRLYDKDIRKEISDLYGVLIDSILKESSEEQRILLFKSLIPAIKSTIDYFKYLKNHNLPMGKDPELSQVVLNLINHCTHVIQKVGIKDAQNTRVFDGIMRQVFISEIACEIGECIILYKKTTQRTKKSELTERLTVLLADYNVVMNTSLTLANLKLKEDE